MRLARVLGLICVVAAMAACSANDLRREVQLAEQRGDWDQAVLLYLELSRDDPGRLSYRTGLIRARVQASHQHFERAKDLRAAGALERALVEFQEAVLLDPTNQYAYVEMEKTRADLEVLRQARDGETSLDTLKRRTEGALAQPPVLDPRSDEPIDLDFPEPVSVMDIYRALGKAFGINILFDPRMTDQRMAIELQEVTAQEALETLMRAAGHFYKVLDEHSIVIVQDTQNNRRAYTDLIIQTFFLSNAEVSDVMTMLRTLIESRRIAANEPLNAIVMRDSADRVKVAERLIKANDKARAEVIIDVELMEVDTNKLREVGLTIQPRAIGFSLDGDGAGQGEAAGPGSTIRFSDLEFIDSSSWLVSVPSFLLQFVKDATDAQTLTDTQLRISEGEQASLVIADQIPIPVTSFNTANTIGGNIVPITSFQYQDVGVTIEIEPRVHHNNEVSLKLRVVVSNVKGVVAQQQPIIATREINTTIRLKDGETNFLAGLIKRDETISEQGVAGLSSIPLFGRLFTNKKVERKNTDLVLTLTPHIIRRADITEEDLLPIWVGTETNFTFRGGSPRLEGQDPGPFDDQLEDDSPAEEILERRRQRLQELQQQRRQQSGVETRSEPPPDAGVELAPAAPPRPRRPRDDDNGGGQASLDRPGGSTTGGAAAAAGVQLHLVVPSSAVQGEAFEVAVSVDAARAVSHLPMTLSYDAEALEVLGSSSGDFMSGDRGAQVLIDTAQPGRVLVGASLLGGAPGVTGSGELLRLRFRALSVGSQEISFQKYRALDSELTPIALVEADSARIQVAPSRPGAGSNDEPG